MRKTNLGKKVSLSANAVSIYREKIEELRKENPHLKFTDSEFVSVIVEIFCQKYFKNYQKYFLKIFFDKKKALKEIVKKAKSNEELDKSLIQFLGKTKRN